MQELESIVPHDMRFPLAVLGGVQLNIEGVDDSEDFFLPLSFFVVREVVALVLKASAGH